MYWQISPMYLAVRGLTPASESMLQLGLLLAIPSPSPYQLGTIEGDTKRVGLQFPGTAGGKL
jgi:hypothetical protein